MRTLFGTILAAAALGVAQTPAAAHEGVCAGTRFVVSDGELWRDNENVGRSGHMGHALVYCGNGRILDFTSNCAGMERAAGHSGYGWMEYRISDDYGKTFGPVRVLPCSRRMYDEGRHTALCEKAVRAPDGRIVLFFQITDTSRPISCEPWSEPLMAVSDDGGETFSDFMPTGADAGRIYDAVCDDRYVYFIMQSSPNFPGSKPEHVYKVYRAGADLKFAPHVLPIDPVGRGYGALEFAEDGTLHAYAYNSRNETEMDVTTSRDCGETWSAPRTSRVALKIRNPQVRRLGGTWFLIGRNGGFGKGDALAFYSSPDGVNWDGGVKLDVRPDGTGTGYYGCMLPIFEPGRPPRMLMQYSRPYKSSCVNVIHRTITLPDARPCGGALCLSFDDRNFAAWERCLPLFAKYGAHATFFVYGAIDGRAEACMRRLAAAGHSIGLHGRRHQRAPQLLAKLGEEGYLREELLPQLSVCREKGLSVRSFAYPMSDRTDATDALLLRHFDRLRTGAAKTGMTFPTADAAGRKVLVGMPAGSPDDAPDRIVAMMPSLAAECKTLVIYSHNIEKPGARHDHHNIGEADLERILAAAKAAGVAVLGFDELPGSAVAAMDAPDFRPPFDKSDYKGTVGVQVNPWFPLNKAPSHALGGPNVPWKHYEGKNLWAQGMADLLPYGITAWVPEINEPAAWTSVWGDFYKQGDAENVPVKVGMFFGFYSKKKGVEATQDETARQLQRVFKAVGVDVRTHPRTSRAGGFPVVVVYNVKKYSPEEWGRQFAKIDAAVGRNVYLMDVAGLAWAAQTNTQVAAEVDANFERLLRAHLPYWDGISAYANGFRVPYKVIKKVMRDYSQKLYEGMVHQTYTCHFQTGGNEVDLSRNWRDSIDACLESDPDAMLLTNLFDHYENSIVLPCYDREDFLLRYFECRTAKWRGKEFRKEKAPELVVTSHQSVLLGRQDLDFEVVSFPIDGDKKDVTLHLDVCDTSGKVLHEFPARIVKLDGLHVERYSLPSIDFAAERGVVPRLRYEWAGKARAMNYGPMTLIDPSMRPYRLYWARSTRNELRVDGANDWRMDGVGPGGTHHPRALGITQFASAIKSVHQGDRRSLGCKRFGVKRDNVEMYFRDDSSKSLNFALTLPTPAPGRALHWYYMEMENAAGLKYQTLPIWETDGSEESRRTVEVPVWKKDGTIADLAVEAARVPFWHYTMDDDCGRLLVDVSGWGHNGAINGRSGLGGGHLGYTGYNHYHNGPVGMPAKGERTLWRKDADGKGYLEFNGSNDYLIVQGGTAFPGAFTYELAVRPAEIGREMGLLGTCNHQIHLDLLADGRLKAWRASPREGAGGVRTKDEDKWTSEVTSDMKLEAGKWAKIAVVYDLREMALYIDGVKCGSAKSPPAAGHEWLNFLMVGAKCEWVWTPKESFKGDIGEMRFTGRSLAKSELAR